MVDLEGQLAYQIRVAGLPEPVRQFRAIPGRRYRWDIAWPDLRLLLEVQGAVWTAGKHGRGSGIVKDQEKLNLSTINCYYTLQVSANHIRDGRALRWIQQAISALTPAP